MKLKETKAMVIGQLSPWMDQFGFQYVKPADRFEKLAGDCKYIYRLQMLAWTGYHAISAYAEIEVIEAHKVIKKVTGLKYEPTVGNEVGHLDIELNNGQKERVNYNMLVESEDDIADCVAHCKEYFERIALSYYQTYTPEQIFQVLTTNLDKPTVHINSLYVYRLINILLLGKILKKDNYKELEHFSDDYVATHFEDGNIHKIRYYGIKEVLKSM